MIRSRTKYLKLLGSGLVPIFLLMLLPYPIVAQDQNIKITFQISTIENNQAVFNDYNLDPKFLFNNIFSASVSSDKFNDLKKDSRIVYAEEDRMMFASAVTTSDPFFTTESTNEDKQWYLSKIKIPEAWEHSKGNRNVVVAVIDTGIHATHIELNDGRISDGYDVVTDKTIPADTNSDDNGHGTAVAGVLGAIPNNQRGISGINWNISIMPVKALLADGTGDTSYVSKGIVWAADNGANIINLSLGGPGFGSDQTMSNAISYAYNKGALLIAAAGNDLANQGRSLDANPVYPVCGDNGQNMIVGVVATDVNDKKADFSNYGAICIDIAAPGKKIITSAYLPSDPANNILIYGSGTSLATPIVSGVAALLKASQPNLSNVEIRKKLLDTAENIDAINTTSCLGGNCNGFLGKGRINAFLSVLPTPLLEGSLIREIFTSNIYLIQNGLKRFVSSQVFTQRGLNLANVTDDTSGQLAAIPAGSPLPPLDGTLIKSPSEAQVYVLEGEVKRPLTYLVFITRGYNFANIKILPHEEVISYPTGEWHEPPDGTMVLISGNPTVYVMDGKIRRPVTYFVFTQRRLSFAKVIRVTPDEFSHIPAPSDSYWMPPMEGTLVKSSTDPSVYVIEAGLKRLLSYEVFMARNYKFGDVRSLPQVEIDVIAPGLALLTQ
jgi:subtilisin family serine protease